MGKIFGGAFGANETRAYGATETRVPEHMRNPVFYAPSTRPRHSTQVHAPAARPRHGYPLAQTYPNPTHLQCDRDSITRRMHSPKPKRAKRANESGLPMCTGLPPLRFGTVHLPRALRACGPTETRITRHSPYLFLHYCLPWITTTRHTSLLLRLDSH